jgi:hypothetical protein
MPEWEDLAGEQLLAEYVKIEESGPSEEDRLFQHFDGALMVPAEVEERLFDREHVDQAAEEQHFVTTLLEEMSSLETEYDQFEATTKVRRENGEHHAGDEE